MYRKYQMVRIIEVASLIHKEPRRWTRPRLAAHLEVNPATIQRYIDLLRDMGSEGRGRMIEKQKRRSSHHHTAQLPMPLRLLPLLSIPL